MTQRKQQLEEIGSIKKRSLEVELSDADVRRLAEKAGAVGLSVGELLYNFIGDLVDGTYSNGSDERMYAAEWFNRCWFAKMEAAKTFLSYAIENDCVDEIIALHEYIAQGKKDIAEYEESIQKFKKSISDMEVNVENGAATQISLLQENIDDFQESIDNWQEELDDDQQRLDYYWSKYKAYYEKSAKENQSETLKQEIEKILEWHKAYVEIKTAGGKNSEDKSNPYATVQ